MSERLKVKLGDIVDSCLGKMLHAEKNRGDYQPYLTNVNVRWGDFDLSNLSLMKFEPSEAERYGIKSGDLIICEGGEPGRCAIWREQMPNMRIQKALHRVRAKNGFDIRYLYYWLLLAGKTGRLERYFTGSTIKHLPGDGLSEIEIELPSIDNQKAVSTILGKLDQKIALNNAINAELEKAVKLLYDYWFVQFDFPNAEGKPYRSSGGKMVYNGQLKRKVPKGWQVDKLESKLNMQRGVEPGSGAYSEEATETETVPFIRVSDLGSKPALYISEEAANGNRCVPTDVLVSFDGSVGKMAIAMEGAYSSGIRKITPKDGDYSDALIYFIFQSEEIQKTIAKYAVGSNILHAAGAIEHLMSPYEEVVARTFMAKIDPMYKKIVKNHQQNKELTALRDFLLPLLMNGQVTVAASEVAVTEVKTSAVPVPAVSNAKARRSTVFKRLVLSAYILDNICDEPTAGRVKFEKLLFLSEHCARLPLHSEFHRAAAGPYDRRALYAIENQLKKNQWFQQQKITGESRAYSRLPKVTVYKTYIDANLNEEEKGVIDKLIRLFKTARTIQCEIVATLYGAWNDFIINGENPTDDQIVDEVLTNWHESKERIGRKRWLTALGWMRQNDIVPSGYGVSTKNVKSEEEGV
jgi:type I restriction enzyme S subunit